MTLHDRLLALDRRWVFGVLAVFVITPLFIKFTVRPHDFSYFPDGWQISKSYQDSFVKWRFGMFHSSPKFVVICSMKCLINRDTSSLDLSLERICAISRYDTGTKNGHSGILPSFDSHT